MSETDKILLGIDEAGRGSVVGPLVIAGVVIDEKTLKYFETTEITDSKQLSSEKREELVSIIKEKSTHWKAEPLSAIDIDKAVLSTTSNLNMLELQIMTKIIIDFPEVTDIYIDAISKPDYCTTNLKTLLKKEVTIHNLKKISDDHLNYVRSLQENSKNVRLIAQNKADLNYKVVSAASIIAKVTRDMAIRKIEEEYSLEKGILASGYPNEHILPFLTKYKKEIKKREFPFVRYSWDWQPLKTIISGNNFKQAKLF